MVFSSGITSVITVVGNTIIHNTFIVKNDEKGMAFHGPANTTKVFNVSSSNIGTVISELYAEISDSNIVWVESTDKIGTSFLTRFALYVIAASRCKHETDPNWCISMPDLFKKELDYIKELIPSWNADKETLDAQIKKCVKLLS